ncbi:MAG: hypothetical protein MJ093_06110 [Saccharofermentans sp.]|nr:hypothetical protein [Saccharofermentans sp.]
MVVEFFTLIDKGIVCTVVNNEHITVKLGDILFDESDTKFTVIGIEMIRRKPGTNDDLLGILLKPETDNTIVGNLKYSYEIID